MKKAYKGYKSFDYLEKGVDYRYFKLAAEVERVPSYQVSLSRRQEEKFNNFIKDNLIISLHDHPTIMPEDLSQLHEYEKQGREFTAFAGLAHSCLDVIFDNMMDGTSVIHSKSGWKWRDIIHDIGMRTCDIDHQDFLIRGENLDDFYRARRENSIAWVKSLESATMIENELERIEILYGLGVRMMGITYSESNNLGNGLKEKYDGGLTIFGREAVRRMNKVGMAIDVSHCGDQTALDVIEVSSKPVFITHVGARSLWDIKRLKPDNVLKACAAKGGVIGIEAAPHTTITGDHPAHSIESYMEHFEYIRELVGIEHVAFGPDALYGDHVGLHDLFSSNMSIEEQTGTSRERIDYVKGLENPTEALDNIIRWLIKQGYSEKDMARVVSGNIIRVLEQAWV